MSDYNALGKMLKMYRLEHDLKQLELADRIGINHTVLSAIEGGKRKPGPKTLKKIAVLLHIPHAILALRILDPDEVADEHKSDFENIIALIDQMF